MTEKKNNFKIVIFFCMLHMTQHEEVYKSRSQSKKRITTISRKVYGVWIARQTYS